MNKQLRMMLFLVLIGIISLILMMPIAAISNSEQEISLTIPESKVQIKMKLIPAGRFTMGSPEGKGYSTEWPQHQVEISEPFYMGICEVTQEQWKTVMGTNPSGFSYNATHPVESINWEDCQKFINRLNTMGIGTFRLPTEAEWEYACRAGSMTMFPWGDAQGYSRLSEFAWYVENSNNQTHPVGQKRPNAWGLYDMHGNVREWCSDWWTSGYSAGFEMDPKGPKISSTHRILRGGSWRTDAVSCRSAHRDAGLPWDQYTINDIGFRLVRTIKPQISTTPIGAKEISLTIQGADQVQIKMKLIPAGTFLMGSPSEETEQDYSEGPQHMVTISESFYMGIYEVTQEQWAAVMGTYPSKFGYIPPNPVEQVSWYDCQDFITELNTMGIGTFRLPTEAEWEYACRAGSTTRYPWGNNSFDDGIFELYGWYRFNSGEKTNNVGRKYPNPWGLYDMHGNVYEWCSDWFGPYQGADQTDPKGKATGSDRVIRGGYFNSLRGHCRSASRYYSKPTSLSNAIGFRLVMTTDLPNEITTPKIASDGSAGQISTNEQDLVASIPENYQLQIEMQLIPAGSFKMGSPGQETDRYSNEGPEHQVTISKPFYIGTYEVTQAQWAAVMGTRPSYFGYNADYPVEQVSWNECQEFIQKLNTMGIGTFRLPTEAEWEYACRAGSTTRFPWGDDPGYNKLGEYAWYNANSKDSTHNVGQKKPNAWGLYDMHGNVWEWCSDLYSDTYNTNAQTDPRGPSSGSYRILRGGSYQTIFRRDFRSAYRLYGSPTGVSNSVGFRLVRTL